MALSKAPPVGTVAAICIMNGTGKINPSQVVAHGSYNEYDDSTPVPKTLLAFGTWKAKELLSLSLIGRYGSSASGIAEMQVDLVQDFPSPDVIPATLKVVCNIPAAGLLTGEDEGFTLTVPGGAFGPFEPFGLGLSIFTTENEVRD